MIYLINNIDFILTVSVVTIFFVAFKLVPVRKTWNQESYVFIGILLLFISTSWVAVEKIDSIVRNELKETLLSHAPTYAWIFEHTEHSKISFNTNLQDPEYLKFIEYEKDWLKSNPFISDIYTLKRKDDGKIAFLVDSETDYNKNGLYDESREARTPIGEIFEKDIHELQDAFDGKSSFTFQPYTDRWGSWVSAFVPLRNKNHQVDAVLALDFPSSTYLSEIRNARYLALLCSSLFYLLIASYISTLFRHKKYNSELSNALTEAKRANAIKSEFLANMSHEIRTPLNAILGMISLLSKNSFDADTNKKINILKYCSDNLLVLINDILDFSKIEAGKLQIENTNFEVASTISEVIELLRPTADEKGIGLNFQNEYISKQWINADLARFRQVLINLVTNAIKFTPQGFVAIKLNLADINAEETEVNVQVTDTGIGIELEAQKKLFQSFSQADASITRKFGGTGLGLAITKGIIDAMGGRIWLESSPKNGSTFSFSLKAKLVQNPPKEVRDKSFIFDSKIADKKPLRILVADDQMSNRFLAVKFLSLIGYTAVT